MALVSAQCIAAWPQEGPPSSMARKLSIVRKTVRKLPSLRKKVRGIPMTESKKIAVIPAEGNGGGWAPTDKSLKSTAFDRNSSFSTEIHAFSQ
jgi:hypothetical protein